MLYNGGFTLSTVKFENANLCAPTLMDNVVWNVISRLEQVHHNLQVSWDDDVTDIEAFVRSARAVMGIFSRSTDLRQLSCTVCIDSGFPGIERRKGWLRRKTTQEEAEAEMNAIKREFYFASEAIQLLDEAAQALRDVEFGLP